ncbi:amino acid adenylation domain-containing protein [Nostoc sp.]|uniref:amino acid adenylation domain-containing protein n=1 Tax=Nostoc sp. TaxID=1180 RepID=UPI002FFADE63
MNLNQFVAELAEQGVKLWVEDDQLRVRAAKGVLTPDVRDLLALHKAELVKLLRHSNAIANDIPSIVRVERTRDLPLSFAQEQMWFLSQLSPDNPLYSELNPLQIKGYLNIVALEKSLNYIVQRHEVLRTNFVTFEERPVQVIADSFTLTMPVVDLRELAQSDKKIAIQGLVMAEDQRTFNLASDPLIRATLLKLTEVEHILLLTIHHIIFDDWSERILLRELATVYSAFCNGLSPELPELPIQYADFAVWQRQWLSAEVLSSQLTYWKQRLSGAPSLLELPIDRVRPSIQTFQGARQSFELSGELRAAVITLTQRQRVTLFMTLLAAFKILLYRYTGQTDMCVGTVHATRDRQEIQELIGMFANALVLRTDMSDNPSFEDLLSQVREVALGAYAHQDLPFEKLVEELRPARDLSHTPLVQVMLGVFNLLEPQIQSENLTLSRLATQTVTAKFDLTLILLNTASGLIGTWEYNTDLFDASTIERMAGHFQTLLAGIVANPQQKISSLPILSEAERQQLLVEWNFTLVDYPKDICIHQLFEAQVEKTPDAVAVVLDQEHLTYRELNCRANQLAQYLRSLGVGADVLVGLCIERSLEMVVGLLGILKAGGAYVPLDPDYPSERLRFMLEDTEVSVLLTQHHLLEKLPEHQAQSICLDTDWQLISQSSPENLITAVQATNLAYVIYTSGSTGRPKGVMIEHQSLVNFTKSEQIQWGINQSDRVLQFSSLSFDVFAKDIYPCLSVGGTLVLRTEQMLNSWLALIEGIERWQITVLNISAAYWHELVTELARTNKSLPQSLRLITIGGERLQPEKIKLWYEYIQKKSDLYKLETSPQLINGYGPTETTIQVICCPLSAQMCDSDLSSIPIGRPLPNTQIYILDSNLQPVPVGVPGELHIGGIGLARGYLNRPDLTTEKFILNPFSHQPHSRLYKTGDLARYLDDGNMEYLGRIDNQVKIRGFRIELGEIEAALSQHDDLQASCIIAREDSPGNKRLVAYVVPHQGQTLTLSELRSFLLSKLPKYMMPHTFVILESLPLTPNGKVDHRSLPAPQSRGELEVSFVAPRTQIEQTLAQIWAKVLRLEQVGIHDNFFEVGGDSILSIQVITRANQVGINLSVKQLFGHQTIAELATVAGTTKAIEVEQGLVTGTLPLTPIQHWFFEQNLPQLHHFNQSFLLSVPSDLKPELLEQVLQQLLVHHDALRLRFTHSDLGWQQIHSKIVDHVAFSFVDLSALSESEQQAAIEARATSLQASLNLSENLMQVALFWLGIDKRARLLIVIHHLVVDGVSWRILLEDLQTSYQQLSQGKRVHFPPKTTSFKDWAYKLTAYAQSEALKSELAYWLNESRSCVRPIPVDYLHTANTVASAVTVSVSLDEAETRALLQDVPKTYNTQINDILLTALVLVLARWTNSKCVLFDLEGHGREDIVDGVDLSRTIGWFTTIFPVLVELEAIDNLGTALKSVKEQLRAIPNKGIGYGLLRYLTQDAEIATQLQAFPQAEISFNYLGQFDQVLNTSSLVQLASESAGVQHSLDNNRTNLLDINSIITDKQLQIDWTYSTNVHQHTTIESLAQEFVTTLRSLIAHCLSADAGGYTPSDFPLAKLNQIELDQVLASQALKQELGRNKWKNIEDIYPLSPMQQGMLFESLSAPNSGVYFEQLSCTLSGKLDVPAFEQAWQQVVAQHSVFRTAFIWEPVSQPLQVVHRQVKVTLQTHDWRELSVEAQQQQLELFLQLQRQQGFQLSVAPLLHLNLIQLGADSYQFVWSHHHLLLDGWSLPLVLKDLLDFYQAFSQGKIPLQATASYRNYIAWLQKQDLALAKEFWREKLKGFSAPTPLTVDKSLSNRKHLNSYGEQEIQLTTQATLALQTFARQHQLTMNNLIQASWALLLCHYSQEIDVVFGATVSGRPPELVGIESMVGLFINTLPVRVQVSADTQVLDLLKNLQKQQIESEQYSYSSLVEIQGLSEVSRGTSLFDSIVVFENYPFDDDALQQQDSSFSIDSMQGIEQTNYPLTVAAVPGKQLFVKISYDTSRFDDVTITRMLGHFQTLLEGIVANPKQRILQLPLLTEVEQQQLLVEWNQTQADYPQDKCIHNLFEEQVDSTPDAVAVVFENQQFTYYELNCRANQLAHYLRSLGVSADVLVGLCVERSLFMAIGLLGILKAGGAYVPLDPEYPSDRLGFMLEDTQVSVLLTQQHLVAQLPPNQAKLVFLEEICSEIEETNRDNLSIEVTDFHLANVIYTSGSTGKPKGVMVEHRGLCNLAQAQIQTFGVQSDSRVLQFASLSFDACISEILMTLGSGATLYLGTKDSIMPGTPLIERLRDYGITHITLPPSALAVLPTEELPNLQTIIVAGEACSAELIKLWSVGRNFFNAYGPTEASVCATIAKCTPESDKITIGRPIANTQIYILDSQEKPVPIGVPGELHIGGVGLARGYLNRPELTNEKFIPNPFSNESGSRLYKTGDLARYLSNGNIEYLGRIDNQVKIRGFRIELGEIEAALSQHPAVRETVVVIREDIPERKYLAAYIVSNQDLAITNSKLRSFLKEKLPNYMIPGAFVILDTLPLMPNGKIDRRALPTPQTAHLELTASKVAPRTWVENILAQIWCDVLHLQQVSIHDNFFELGGDSIVSIQIISKANQAGLQLNPKQIFEHQTIAELASVAHTTATIRAEQGQVTGSLPLTPIQHWFFAQNLPEPHYFNQAFLLEIPSAFDPILLLQVVQQLLVHHDALRLRFVQSGDCWQPINTESDNTIPFSQIDLSTIADEKQKAVIETAAAELQASFNLSSGPLVQVAFFALGTNKASRLLIVIHHLAVDGVSWRILLEDLFSGYQQLSQGEEIQLPPKTTSFKYWALRLTEYARSNTLKSELAYWQTQSRHQVLSIPVDYASKTNTVASAVTVSVSLNVEETRALLQEVPKAYKTQINDVLLTALVQVLGKWSGDNSLLLDLEGHGREDIFEDVDLSRTVGWFTTIFPVLLTLKATDNLGNSLKSIKEQLRAVPNRGIGYGLLRYLSGDAEITSTLQALAKAEVSFNYLGQFDWGMQETSVFKIAPESLGSEHSLLGYRSHLLAINSIVVEGQLQIGWTYSENFHQLATIESLAQDFVEALRSLIAHCLSVDVGDYTFDGFENQVIGSLAQQLNNSQNEENKVPLPLHLLELPEGISELLPEDIESTYPLAKMQEFMLHHYSNNHQETEVYHCQQSYDIEDESLSLNAFKKALELLVQKHPAFRTVFIIQSGKPAVQVVKKNLEFSIIQEDISHIKSNQQENYLDTVMKRDRQNLFQIGNPNEPLFRFWIFQKAENRFEFLMSVHHAIIDGWSNNEFLNELYELYSALKKGEEITIATSDIVYKEFVALEKEIIGSKDAASFWKLQLKNYIYTPLKSLIIPVEEVEAVTEKYQLSSEIIADLRQLCGKLKVSPKAIFLSTYFDLIGTEMKENRVSIGIVSNGRTERLSDPFKTLGLFWNMVPFCQRTIEDKSLQIKNVHQSLIDMEPYVRYPLLQILSDQEKMELFFATFNFVQFRNHKNILADAGLKVNGRKSHDQFNFPLNYTVSMDFSEGDGNIAVEYDRMYFSYKDIRSMLHKYIELLKSTVYTKKDV